MSLPAFTFAFQPIVDIESRTVFAYEALVRGPQGEGAGAVFSTVLPESLHVFDHEARLRAIALAASLRCQSKLSLNVMPGSLNSIPDCLDRLLEHAQALGVEPPQLLLEVTEGEVIERPKALAESLNRQRAAGVQLSIDDFGAGYSGLNLLADFQPDLIKLDMNLIRGIDHAGPRQAIVRGIVQVCDDLGIEVIAEGVETVDEFDWFKRAGIRLFQGYLFAKPALQMLAAPAFPA